MRCIDIAQHCPYNRLCIVLRGIAQLCLPFSCTSLSLSLSLSLSYVYVTCCFVIYRNRIGSVMYHFVLCIVLYSWMHSMLLFPVYCVIFNSSQFNFYLYSAKTIKFSQGALYGCAKEEPTPRVVCHVVFGDR